MEHSIKLIQEDFNKVISYSQGLNTPDTDALFEQWHKAKKDFIHRFKGFVWEAKTPVVFNLGEKEKSQRINTFISEVVNTYGNYNLAKFLETNSADFYANKLSSDYTAPNGVVIKAGTKVIKAFKHFETNEACLARLQTAASMLIQEDKVEGTLCFSVHPLDYISSSETTYGWRSCHALDGDYRSGNLSYMCDTVTIVCYLKGDKEEILPRFPAEVKWNSKKWRMLIHYNHMNRLIFAGRQYPFYSENALDIIRPYLFEALGTGETYWSSWHNDYISHWKFANERDTMSLPKYLPIADRIRLLNNLVIDVKSPENKIALHYNDLLHSTCYTPYYAWNLFHWYGEDEQIEIGSQPMCICCGKKAIEFTDLMTCQECECKFREDESDDQIVRCDVCGSSIYEEEAWYTHDGSRICDICRRDGCVTCYDCGALIFKDHAHYVSQIDHFLCDRCWEVAEYWKDTEEEE